MPKTIDSIISNEREMLGKDLKKEMSADTRKLQLELTKLLEETRAFHKDVSEFIAETREFLRVYKDPIADLKNMEAKDE